MVYYTGRCGRPRRRLLSSFWISFSLPEPHIPTPASSTAS